jgi:hypothetical protein
MYETSSFVNDFLRDPQAFLEFADFRATPDTTAADPALDPALEDEAPGVIDSTTWIRKVFLGAHARFYLVVVELHCDTSGFPSVLGDKPCQASFVVRRRNRYVPAREQPTQQQAPPGQVIARVRPKPQPVQDPFESPQRPLASVDDRATTAKDTVAAFQPWTTPGMPPAKASRDTVLRQAARDGRDLAAFAAASRAKLASLQEALAESAKKTEMPSVVAEEGWIPTGPNRGGWTILPDAMDGPPLEASFPLYPLVPDPRAPNHAGHGRAIFFGVVPTGSADLDDYDQPRFDDAHEYFIRCFVRRRDPNCPPDECGGDVFWSDSTETYKLASYFDPVGTAHRSITIAMPDTKTLASAISLANSPKRTERAGVRVISSDPQTSVAVMSASSSGTPSYTAPGGTPPNPPGAAAVPNVGLMCVFPIPVLMLVAAFVFKIFSMVLSFIFPPLNAMMSPPLPPVCFPLLQLPTPRPPRPPRPQNPNPPPQVS